jgi:sulfopyruvate decarboxylase TPP-binding subunit
LKEVIQRKIFDYLLKNKIYNFVGVPDSTMKHFIDQGLKRNKILITTREDEAIGIAAGMRDFKKQLFSFHAKCGLC